MNSTNVETNIVRMQFDNAMFEKNVSKTMTTIDKLKEALHFKDASKGFDNLTTAMNGIKFNPLLDGIQQVHNKFTMLDSFTINMFNRITNAAIETGKKITSALTIDPVKTGFAEYEEKINAIQVIAANTGALNSGMEDAGESVNQTMQALHDIWAGRLGNGQYRFDVLDAMGLNHENVQSHVNEMAYGGKTYKDIEAALVSGGGGTSVQHIEDVLDELNLYADKTIYNFTQMTKAIGQFTTAGIDVDTAATSVKGIANLAAYVGAPASDASRAMFQLSQALATGRVRLQDWMSLEHTAGMGGKIFQDALVATAEHYGIAAQAAIDAEGSFRNSLRHDWLTSDVLNETLAKLSGSFDELYWAEKGYTDSEIQSIMDLGRVATDAATKVRTVSMMWDAMKEAAQSTWTQTWEYIIGGYEDAPKLLTAINDAVSALLGNMNASRNEAFKFWYNAKINGRDDWFRVEEHTQRVKEYISVLDEAGNIKKEFQDSVTKDENGVLWMDGKMLEDGTIERWKKAIGKNGQELKDASGNILYETETIKSNAGIIVDLWHYLQEISEPIVEAFHDTFNTGLREALMNLTRFMKQLASGLINSRKPLQELYDTFRGVFSVIKIGMHVVKSVSTLFWNIIKRVVPSAGTGLLGLTGMIGKFLGTAGGLEKILYIIDDIFWNLDNTVGAFIGDTLFNLVSLINDLVFRLFQSEDAMEKVSGIAGGLFKILELGQHVLMAIGGIGFALIDKLFPKLADALFGTASGIGAMADSSDILESMITGIDAFAAIAIDWINNLEDNVKGLIDTFVTFVKDTTGIDLVAIWDFLVEKATALWNILKEINWQVIFAPFVVAYQIFRDGVAAAETIPDKIKAIKDSIKGFFDELGVSFGAAGGKIKDFFDGFKQDAEAGVAGALPDIENKLGGFGEAVKNFLMAIGVTDAQSAAKLATGVVALGAIIKLIINAVKASDGITGIITGVSDIFTGFSDFISGASDAIEAFTRSLQADAILKIAGAIGIMTLSVIALALIPEDKLERALSMLIGMFTGLFFILKQLTGFLTGVSGVLTGAGNGVGLGIMMAGIGFAILEIVASMAILAKLDSAELGAALAAMYVIGLVMKMITGSFVGVTPGAFKGVAGSLMAVAAVIWIVAKVIEELSVFAKFNEEGIKIASGIVGGIAAALFALIYGLSKLALIPNLNFAGIAPALLGVAFAVSILAASMIGIMAAIIVLTKVTGDPEMALATLGIAYVAIVALSAIMAGILIVLSKFPIAVLTGVAGSVIALTSCIAVLAGLVIIMSMFVERTEDGKLRVGKLWNAVGIIAVLAVIVTGMYALLVVINRMSGVGGSIGALIALGGVVAAIAGMASIIAMLSLIPEENLYRAMSALEGITLAVMGILAVTAILVGVSSVAFPVLAPALVAISVAFLAFAGAGALFAAAIWLIVDAVVNAWGLIQDFSVNGSEVINNFVEQLDLGMDAIKVLLTEKIPTIVGYIFSGIANALGVATTFVPIIGLRLGQILLQIFANACLMLAGSAAVIIRGVVWIIQALDQEIAPLIDAVIHLLITVVLGVGQTLATQGEDFANALVMLIAGILIVVGQTFRKVGEFLYETFKPVIDFIVGWWQYLVDQWAKHYQAIDDAARKNDEAFLGLLAKLTEFKNKIIMGVGQFFTNLILKISGAFNKLKEIVTKVINFVFSIPNKFKEAGQNIATGVATGIKNSVSAPFNAIKNLTDGLYNLFTGPKGIDAHSPSRLYEMLGQYIPQGVALGIKDGTPDSLNAMSDYANNMTGTFGDTMSTALGCMFSDNTLLNGSMDLSSEGEEVGASYGYGLQNGFADVFGVGGAGDMFGLQTPYDSTFMANLTPVISGDRMSTNNLLDQLLGPDYAQFDLNGNVTGIDGLNQFSANIQNSIDESSIMQEIKSSINMLRAEVNMFNQGVAGHVKAIIDEMDKDIYISPDKLVGATGDQMYDYISVKASNESRSGG